MDSFNQLTKTTTPSKRATFLATFRHQEWSLPDNIIYYITKNPSTSKCYGKMIQTCKHFFIKNPILIVTEFQHFYQKKRWDERFDWNPRFNISKITSKIWVTYKIDIIYDDSTESYMLSSIISKIYKSDIKVLYLCRQDIDFDNLKFLASKCEQIEILDATVLNKNGSVVPLENIIKSFPKVTYFKYDCCYTGVCSSKIISSKTASELLKILHFSKLASFELYGIPEVFDIETFYDYIKKNKYTYMRLEFCEELSVGYKIRLQAIVDEIVEHECSEYMPPGIDFPGMTRPSNDKM